jgi:hypothetical protein
MQDMTRAQAQAKLIVIREAIDSLLASPKSVAVSGGISYTNRDMVDLREQEKRLVTILIGLPIRTTQPYYFN